MNRLIAALAILMLASPAFSQSLATLEPDYSSSAKLINFASEDWSFFHDTDQNFFFIDFENVDVNLSDLKVVNEKGEVLIEEKLLDLPVNSIFELDLSKFLPGTYRVEIRTFTSVIVKEIIIS